MSDIKAVMYEALKKAKWCFDEELHGREVNEKQWEQCYSMVSWAMEEYKKPEKEPESTIGGRRARSGRIASS